jgi:hypothetical protein
MAAAITANPLRATVVAPLARALFSPEIFSPGA